MRAFCLTVDLDRDVNIQVVGRSSAGSIDRGNGDGPRFTSSERGLSILVDMLDEIGIKATFFSEAETLRSLNDPGVLSAHEVGLHGSEHEDLTSLNEDEIRSVIEDSYNAVRDTIGKDPKCFRAPYMRVDDRVIDILPKFGIEVDSSFYTEMSGSLLPYRLDNGILEVPVPEGKDTNGKKISAYLWPMHEGKRIPSDYVGMAEQMNEGVFVLATHTWHMVESRDRGMMSGQEIGINVEKVRSVLTGIIDAGIKPCTLSDVKDKME